MQHVVDLDAGDGGALKRRHQNAAQRVAKRQAEATLKRFGDNGRLTRRVIAGLYVKLGGLDQFLPVLVDHKGLSSILVARLSGPDDIPREQIKTCDKLRGHTQLAEFQKLRRGGAWAGGSRCGQSASRRGST